MIEVPVICVADDKLLGRAEIDGDTITIVVKSEDLTKHIEKLTSVGLIMAFLLGVQYKVEELKK